MNKKTPKLYLKFKELAHKEVGVLISVLAVVIGIWIFALIANEVIENETQVFDEIILKSFRTGENYQKPAGPGWLPLVMRDITSLGGGTVLSLFTTVIVIFLVLKKEYWAMWLVIAASAGGAAINFFLKELFGRARPSIVSHLTTVESLSFPSGHSTMSAVMYLTLAAILSRVETKPKVRIYIISVALLLTFIIGISRIYLGVHYPTDVLAGWCVGLVWASICWFAAWFFQQKLDKKNN